MAKITTTYADRDVQYPNRYSLTNVSGTTYDLVRQEGTVNVAGTLLNKIKFDEIKTVVNGLDDYRIADETSITNLNTGWVAFPTTLAYSSIDSPTGVMTTGADTRTYLEQGMKIKYDQTHSLTAYWNLDANSNSQVGSFNGTDTNITYSAGKFSNCAVFNGTTSKIVIADATLLKPTGAFTIGMWFKSNVTATAKVLFQSYSQNTSVAGFYTSVNASNSVSFLTGKNTGSTANTDFTFLNGVTNVCDNAWHYIVTSYNNNYGQIYVDGKLEVAGYMLAPVYASTNYVRIGCSNNSGTDAYFNNGSIDDLFLINGYALSEEYIRAKYIASTAQGSSAFAVTKTAFISADPTATTITCYHGTDSMLINADISNIYYSNVKKPYGFNINPNKWTVMSQFTGDISGITGQTAKTLNTIILPIGIWKITTSGYSSWYTTTSSAFDGRVGFFTTADTEPSTIGRAISAIDTTTASAGTIRVNSGITISNYFVSSKTTLYWNIFQYLPNATYRGSTNCNCYAVSNYL